MKHKRFLVLAAVGALVLAGCTGGDGPGEPSPTPSPAPSSPLDDGTGGGGGVPEPTDEPTSPQPGDGNGGGEWTTGTVTVTRDVPVPPVPRLVGIRSAAHPDQGYDRLVFDFSGQLPGYTVRYVDEVREDPSDQPVTVPGRRFLLVVFTPAQAHTDAGAPLISPTHKTLDYPMLRGYALAGDFEGYVSVGIGLDDVVGYRVGELPGRIYIDVAA